jgi:hypothetical protein
MLFPIGSVSPLRKADRMRYRSVRVAAGNLARIVLLVGSRLCSEISRMLMTKSLSVVLAIATIGYLNVSGSRPERVAVAGVSSSTAFAQAQATDGWVHGKLPRLGLTTRK